jgi:hypothetical protein
MIWLQLRVRLHRGAPFSVSVYRACYARVYVNIRNQRQFTHNPALLVRCINGLLNHVIAECVASLLRLCVSKGLERIWSASVMA